MTYIATVVLTMLVLPAVSVLMQLDAAPLLTLIGKWFVFWGVGARLLIAGVRQYAQPGFTSRDILGIEDARAHVLVRELGGANIATGLLALASLVRPDFVLPTAIWAALFYGVAALEHLRSPHRGRNEWIALVSDLWAVVVLVCFVTGTLVLPA